MRRIVLAICTAFVFGTVVNAHAVNVGMYGLTVADSADEFMQITKSNGFGLIYSGYDIASLNKAQTYGLKCLVNFNVSASMASDETQWKAFLNLLRSKVTELKSHPAIYAWYPVDEPDGQRISPAKIKEMVNIIRSVDTSHPIMTVVYDSTRWGNYLSYFDIIGVDPYLKLTRRGDYEKPEVVATVLKKLKSDLNKLKLRKRVWSVLGAFDLQPKDSDVVPPYRKPTPEEFNAMLKMAIDEKVDGILVYSLYAAKDNPTYKRWNLPVDDPNLWQAVRKVPQVVNK
ncbi:hypothetical protein GMLC_27970 [Geomonas limicola]|uniref:Glycoside hydrolase family 2 catalytic domain-containing protein n=1 Tax=Geomonas limicola TaxID=2740186 RepID=A0A6V8N9H4_9BACT|nr:glycoside hydrolase family 2 TIM barrel-domain containing protein [Geomonas limicola]GFO69218.1 hypothetical protein GMLC_27970 [Geomonas limicola]